MGRRPIGRNGHSSYGDAADYAAVRMARSAAVYSASRFSIAGVICQKPYVWVSRSCEKRGPRVSGEGFAPLSANMTAVVTTSKKNSFSSNSETMSVAYEVTHSK